MERRPTRLRVEQATSDAASTRPTEMDTISVLADIVQQRRTAARRLIAALDDRERIARRAWLSGVLSDVAEGTCSVLEHGYLQRVERAHGLPRAARQQSPDTGPRIYRDVLYPEYDQAVELDGRRFHDSAEDRDADLDRDLDAAVDRLGTVRLGWGQVFGRPCRTAAPVAILLQHGGWQGSPKPWSRL